MDLKAFICRRRRDLIPYDETYRNIHRNPKLAQNMSVRANRCLPFNASPPLQFT